MNALLNSWLELFKKDYTFGSLIIPAPQFFSLFFFSFIFGLGALIIYGPEKSLNTKMKLFLAGFLPLFPLTTIIYYFLLDLKANLALAWFFNVFSLLLAALYFFLLFKSSVLALFLALKIEKLLQAKPREKVMKVTYAVLLTSVIALVIIYFPLFKKVPG